MSSSQDNNIFKKTSFLAGNNSAFIEEYYLDYLNNPSKLPAGWKEFFDGLKENEEIISKTLVGPSWAPKKKIKNNSFDLEDLPNEDSLENNRATDISLTEESAKNSIRAIMLIRAYRIRGHLVANLDPLELMTREEHPELKPDTYGFTKNDFNKKIFLDGVLGLQEASLSEIISILKSSRRPLTTIVWHWSGHYTDDGNIGAQEIHNEYRTINRNIPFHFVIMKNGDIQSGFPIHNGSRHVAPEFNEFSFGVAFVGGYNGPRGGLPGGVRLDAKSYTTSQWKSFNKIMKAFYITIPGGDAFGQNDLGDNPGEGPGFSVSDIISKDPFNRKNTCDPIGDGSFLTRKEIVARLV